MKFVTQISDEDIGQLNRLFDSAKFPLAHSFLVEPTQVVAEIIPDPFPLQKMVTARRTVGLNANLKTAWERDEDEWMTIRNSFLKDTSESKNIKPESLISKKFRCLIDCGKFPGENIRNYLTMYEQICIVAPIKNTQDEILASLGISRAELVELVRMDKLQMLLPKSIELYDASFREEVMEANEKNVHFARRITAFTVNEVRKRNPFFFPTVSIQEKRIMLASVDEAIGGLKIKDERKLMFRKAISEVGHGWATIPSALNQFDSEMLSHYGVTQLLEAGSPLGSNPNFKFLLNLIIPSVDLAAATDSVLIPTTIKGVDTSPFCTMIAQLYSGVPSKDWVMQKNTYANFAVDEILVVSKYVSVIELAETFNSAEITRFRNPILSISQNQENAQELEEVVNAFNHFVRKYEKDKDNLNTWNIKGFVLGFLGKESGIPMGSWMLNILLSKILKGSSKNEILSKIIDTLEANIYGTYPNAVLVSKMRDKAKKKL